MRSGRTKPRLAVHQHESEKLFRASETAMDFQSFLPRPSNPGRRMGRTEEEVCRPACGLISNYIFEPLAKSDTCPCRLWAAVSQVVPEGESGNTCARM